MKRMDNDFSKKDFKGFDDIKASPDLKRKVYTIIEDSDTKSNKAARYRKNFSYLRWIASAAACIIFLCSVLVWGFLKPASKLPGTSHTPGNTSGGPSPQDKPNKIYIWWDSDPHSRNVINSAIEDFKNDYPEYKNIIFEVYTPSSQDKVLLEMNIEAGTAPDIFRMPHNQMYSLLQKGYIENLADPKYGAGNLKEKFHESAWKAVSRDDKIWGLPLDMSTIVMAYNKNLLDQVGMAIPENFNEMVELWERVAGLGKDYYGYCIGDEEHNSSFSGITLLQFSNLGGSILSEDWTHATINSQASIDAFETMLDIKSKKGVFEFYREGLFEPGKLAMIELDPWWINGFINNSDKFVVQTIPEFKKGVTPHSFIGLYALGVVSKPGGDNLTQDQYDYKNKVSYEFIKYITTNAKYQYDFCIKKNLIPSLLSAQNMAPYTEGVHKVFVDQLKNAVPLPNVSCWVEIETAFYNASNEIFNGRNPKDALDSAAEVINNLLKKDNES